MDYDKLLFSDAGNTPFTSEAEETPNETSDAEGTPNQTSDEKKNDSKIINKLVCEGSVIQSARFTSFEVVIYDNNNSIITNGSRISYLIEQKL